MSTDSLLVQINATVCLAISWPVNLLLIWLIVYRTNQELRVWSRVLLQSAVLDMLLSLCAFLNQMEYISQSNGIYSKFYGPIGNSNLNLTRKQITFYFFFYMFFNEFCRHAIVVQFGYRWLVICKEKQVSNKCYLLMLLLPCTFVSVETLFQFLDRIQNCNIGCETDGELIFFISYSSMYINSAVYMVFTIITSNAIITFTILCWRKTRQGLMQENARSRKINRQVSIVLIAQAVYPIGLSMLPGIANAIFYALGMPIPAWLSLLTTQVWNTVVYPLIAILVIGHYRRTLVKMFGFKGRNAIASSGTQHVRQAIAIQAGSGGMIA